MDPTKGHSLYQISSKMLPGWKVITLVGKKRKEVAWLGLELTTSHLEVQCANHYTMETFMMIMYFFKCHYIKVITFEPGNIFELTWYSEWPLVQCQSYWQNCSTASFLGFLTLHLCEILSK